MHAYILLFVIAPVRRETLPALGTSAELQAEPLMAQPASDRPYMLAADLARGDVGVPHGIGHLSDAFLREQRRLEEDFRDHLAHGEDSVRGHLPEVRPVREYDHRHEMHRVVAEDLPQGTDVRPVLVDGILEQGLSGMPLLLVVVAHYLPPAVLGLYDEHPCGAHRDVVDLRGPAVRPADHYVVEDGVALLPEGPELASDAAFAPAAPCRRGACTQSEHGQCHGEEVRE